MTASLLCIALAVYFEARGEPTAGQLAVAQVILNRVEDRRFPNNACDVVYQRHQFSFFWDGKHDRPTDKGAWDQARAVALTATAINDTTSGANHYHADYTQPYWAEGRTPVRVIGRHVFYRF